MRDVSPSESCSKSSAGGKKIFSQFHAQLVHIIRHLGFTTPNIFSPFNKAICSSNGKLAASLMAKSVHLLRMSFMCTDGSVDTPGNSPSGPLNTHFSCPYIIVAFDSYVIVECS